MELSEKLVPSYVNATVI